jgi:hypothetical protein
LAKNPKLSFGLPESSLLQICPFEIRKSASPKIVGYQEAHFLYTPKSRRTQFPDAQFPFILHSAINIARGFATVHDAGQVIGDVNHANLMISKDATVKLIDCDSFEITGSSRERTALWRMAAVLATTTKVVTWQVMARFPP